jgi:hypothetical protein
MTERLPTAIPDERLPEERLPISQVLDQQKEREAIPDELLPAVQYLRLYATSRCTRLTIPRPWAKKMGITGPGHTLKARFDGQRIELERAH